MKKALGLLICLSAIIILVTMPAMPVMALVLAETYSTANNGSEPFHENDLTISRPDGTESGDFLLAGIILDGGSSTTITEPDNWILIHRTNYSSEVGIATYYKIADSSEPSNYTWTISGSSRAVGAISRWTGVDTSSPIDVSAENSGAVSVITPPMVTTATDGDMLIAVLGADDYGSSTPFLAMTELYDLTNPHGDGPRTSLNYLAQNNAGAFLPWGSDYSNAAWVTQTIALKRLSPSIPIGVGSIISGAQNGSTPNTYGNNLTINTPISTTYGDLLFASVVVDGGVDTTITEPSGWNLIRRTNGSGVGVATYYKVASSSEPADYTWSISSDRRAVGAISRWSGVDTDDPIDLTSGNSGTSSTALALGVPTSFDNDAVIAVFGQDDDESMTEVSGMNELFDDENPSDDGPRISLNYAPQTLAGTTGNKECSLGNSVSWVSQLITLKSAPSNPNVDVHGITVTSTTLTTTETAGPDQIKTFTVLLNTEPSADVRIDFSSSDTTEGTVSPESVTFFAGGESASLTQIRRPSADYTAWGAWTPLAVYQGTNQTNLVNEEPPDANMDEDYITSIYNPGADNGCLFSFPAFSLPSNATNIILSVHLRARDSSDIGRNDIRPMIRLNDTYSNCYQPLVVDPTGIFTEYSYSWDMNPIGHAWTANEINGVSGDKLTQFGVRSIDTHPNTDISAIWAVVTYVIPQTITVTGVDDTDDDGNITYYITATASSTDTNYNGKTATVSVTNIDDDEAPSNHAPTNIALTPSNFDENLLPDTTVGTLSSIDEDASDTHTYSLVETGAYPDNAAFYISGNQLLTAASFDFENKVSYSIKVRTTDSGTGALYYEKILTVLVNNINEAPTNIALDNNNIAENAEDNAVVGNLSGTDPDAGHSSTLTFSLPASMDDNALFNINGSELRANSSFNYEVDHEYSVTIRATDTGTPGLTYDQQFTINVTDVNDAPVAVADVYIVDEDEVLTVTAPGFLSNDSDADGNAIWAPVITVTSPSHSLSYTINPDGSFTYQPQPNWNGADSFTYIAYDGTAYSAPVTVTINVTPVNDAPVFIDVSNNTQTTQYSDKILEISVTASDIEDDSLMLLIIWGANGSPGTFTVDPLSATINGSWTINGTITESADVYQGNLQVSDNDADVCYPFIITVVEEDIEIVFDDGNPVAVKVATNGGVSGDIVIDVDLSELVPDLPLTLAQAGDLSNAEIRMQLVPVGSGGPIDPVISSITSNESTGYDEILHLQATFSGVPVETYTVLVTVYGGYYSGANEDVLCVYDPSLGFTTGGGWFIWPEDPNNPELTGAKTSFGYTMKYNKKSTSIQGSLLIIAHLDDGSLYRIKSNALYGLSLDISGWATFSGKCVYTHVDQYGNVIATGGNNEFIVKVADNNELGTGLDQFWFTVLMNPDMQALGQIFSLDFDLEKDADELVYISGGNIVVPHSGTESKK
jgi:hypothetical protein